MTLQALVGLVLFNAVLLAAGIGLFWGIRGWSTWGELVRLGGVAYLLGAAAVGVVLVVELTLGVPFGVATVLVTAGALAALGVGVGRLLGRTLARTSGDRPLRGQSPWLAVLTAGFVALAVVFFEALFRSGRLAQLAGWDAMAFWVPKGKTIYFFDGLDETMFRELPNGAYPPLLPALEAGAFAFMGGADATTLHLLFWFPLVAFVAAVAGLLAPRVPAFLLWPPLLLVLFTPELVERALLPYADLVLDYAVALAALLVALWLVDRADWQLAGASVLLAAAMLTKREGYMFAACVFVAALAVSWRERRRAWPRIGIAAAAAFAPTLFWRVWFTSHGIGDEAPEEGLFGFLDHFDRAWPSFRLAVSTLFDYGFWLVAMPLAVAAVVLALLAGARRLPLYATLLSVLATLGFTWSTWAYPELAISSDPAVNPISRVTGGLVLVFAGLLPLLLTAAWEGRDPAGAEE